MIKQLLIGACCIGMLLSFSSNATILATGDAEAPYTFSTTITSKAYDTNTGNFYVGLSSAPTDSAGYIISYVKRPIGNATPEFIDIGANVSVDNVSFLALATYPGNLFPLIIYAPNTEPLVGAINHDGSICGTIDTLRDGNDEPATVTNPIVALAANRSFAFAAVPPADGSFGEDNGGIAVICVKETTNTIELTQTQQTDTSGIDPEVRAKKVDPNTPQVQIDKLGVPAINNFATLFWSEYLQRLYIGLDIIVSADYGGKAVVVGYLDNNAALTLFNIAPDSAIDAGNTIVAVNQPTHKVEFSIPFIRTMHCSTGPSYLIVSGGNTVDTDALTRISALPLVDNPTNIAEHGTVANKNSNLVDHKFVIPATTVLGMPAFDDHEVMVGAGQLTMVSTTTISDIQVIGDTVYVAIKALQNDVSDNGVLYSQAIFAPNGKVARWTPWTKRAFPYRGFCDNTSCVNPACTNPPGCNAGCQPGCTSSGICDIGCQNLGVKFFAVDAVNGKVWAVDGTTQEIVRLTAWDRGGCISQLPCKVSEALCDGCYSALDLDQSTIGFQEGTVIGTRRDTTEHRYALFGGCNKVVFTRVSEAIPDSSGQISLQSPQRIITDFSSNTNDCTPCTTNKQNFLLTVLSGAGCVNQLEYSRIEHGDAFNYFFAGTNNGLYVFADALGKGFDVKALTTLDQPPFSTGSWHVIKAPFNVPISAIKTTGNNLYALTRTLQNGSIKCRLYAIPFKPNISSMFASTNILLIAETGSNDFSDVLYFSGIQLITLNNGTGEQLFLATNKGLFISSTITTGVPTWQRVPMDVTIMFAGIAGMDTPYPGTVWPFSVEDPSGCKLFNRSSIYQISGPTDTPNTLTFVPLNFNANSCKPAFKSLDPITAFWSDGARRFFVVNQDCETVNRNRLMVLPYDVDLWNIINPAQQILKYDSFVIGAQRFFWVKEIGITGILMAGMDRGVIALE